MKKLLLLLGALLLLGTSNGSAAATVRYSIHGNFFTGDQTENWGEEEMIPMDDGTWMYYGHFFKGNFGIKAMDADGNQNDWINSSATNTTITTGGTKNGSKSYGSNWWLGTGGDYTFIFDPKNNWLTVTAKATYPDKMFVLSNNSGDWDLSSGVRLEKNGTYNYVGTLEITRANVNLVIADREAHGATAWNEIAKYRHVPSSKNDVEVNIAPGASYSGSTTIYDVTGTYKIVNVGKYDINFNFNTKAITITRQPIYPDELYIHSNNFDTDYWDLSKGVKMNKTADGIFTGSLNLIYDKRHVVFAEKNGSVADDWATINSCRYVPSSKTDTEISFATSKSYTGDIVAAADGSYVLPAGKYTFTVDFTKNKATIEQTEALAPLPIITPVYIRGEFNGYNMQDKWKFQYDEATDSYYFIANDQNGTSIEAGKKFKFADGGYTKVDFSTNNQLTLSGNVTTPAMIYNANNDMTLSAKFQGVIYFKLTGEKTATVIFTKDFDNLWIYGNVNDGYWKVGNNIKLEKTNEPGVFYVANADIYGCWNEYDVKIGKEKGEDRILNGPTNDENYIAFFDHIITNISELGNRYGAVEGNVFVNPEENQSQTEPALYTNEANNFQVADGVYNVTYDLRTWTATFEKVAGKDKKVTLEYVWYTGEGDEPIGGNNSNHSFIYGAENDEVQVGADNSPTHRTARQAVFAVKYREPNYAAKANIRARVNTLADEPSRDADGYYDATENIEYKTIGSATNYYENVTIKLNQAGDYKISAKLHEEAQNCQAWDVPTSTLNVSVAQKAVTAYLGDVDEQPFDTKGNMIDLEDILSFSENSQLEYGKDFTIRVEPATSGWETYPDDAVDEDAAYHDALTSGLYGQYKTLVTQVDKNNQPINVAIDGFYRPLTDEDFDVTYKEGVYNVKINFPCSGVYNVTVEPAESNVNYVITPDTKQVTITPNFAGKFGDFGGLSVTGYSFDENFNIYYDLTNYKRPNDLINEAVFLPGTYFTADVTIEKGDLISSAGPTDPEKPGEINGPGFLKPRRVNTVEDGVEINNVGNINLSELLSFKNSKDTGTIPMTVTVTKNGASSTQTFNIISDDGEKSNPSTGVEGVEAADEAEAVYYNLQGVRVENPEHGIYVKVVGGKAEKVVL